MIFSLTKSETHAHVLLKEDHRKVDGLFKEFETAEESAEKVRVAREICLELTVHAEVEESLYYPHALRAFGKEGDDLVNEARVEHQTLKFLIEQVNGTGTSDELFDANMKVLQEYVKHHVKEEENELFPKLEKEDLDLEALGAQMLERKAQLQNQLSSKRAPGPRNKVTVPSLSASTELRGGVEEIGRSKSTRGSASKSSRRSSSTASRSAGTRSTSSSRNGNGADGNRGSSTARGTGRKAASKSSASSSRSTGSSTGSTGTRSKAGSRSTAGSRTGRSTGSRSASSSRSGRGAGSASARKTSSGSRSTSARGGKGSSSGTSARAANSRSTSSSRSTSTRGGASSKSTTRGASRPSGGASRLRANAGRRNASKGRIGR